MAQSFLILVLLNAGAYALAYGAGRALVRVLAGPWRRAGGAHWTERARLAFAPGAALVWLAIMLSPAAAIMTEVGLEVLDPGPSTGMIEFWMPCLAALGGVLTARYRWVRELWGPRVTPRSWLAGCLILVLLFVPHFLILLLLVVVLPENPSVGGALLIGAGLLAVAFFEFGGGVLLLRLLRVARPAPPPVTAMVAGRAQEMKVPGRVRVFELEWAQANAVAVVTNRLVGFSRTLLEVMAPDEVRAVAAHELAHLVEPRWVRVVRVAHTFAYLGAAPLMKYGGPRGIFEGLLLMLVLALGYRRFARRLEVRADRLESQAIGDSNAYMRSMMKLHEANAAPAVMPGRQTHPHLYDRLLAGGIQPEFPRPKAPSRTKPLLAALGATATTIVVMFLTLTAAAGVRRIMTSRHIRPAAELPGNFRTREKVSQTHFSEVAQCTAIHANEGSCLCQNQCNCC